MNGRGRHLCSGVTLAHDHLGANQGCPVCGHVALNVSREAWNEISDKLRDAGYALSFKGHVLIDMHGITLRPDGHYCDESTEFCYCEA